MSEQAAEPESDHATRTDDGGIEIDIDDAGGRELRDPGEKPPEDEVREIEEERERRLDDANRPDTAEVDNTHRDFDPARGMFTDHEEFDAADERYTTEEQA
jgi:hypothetical protein